MERKKIAIVGLGQRGKIYADYAIAYPKEYELVAIVENNIEKHKVAKEKYCVPVYSDYKKFIADKIACDVVAIATQDNQHLEHATAFISAGYHLLLEKPICNNLHDCLEIERIAKQYDRKVVVCHVLRYTPFYRKIKELIDNGTLGRIITISASENVGYYHQAHSFVRGPWRNSKESSPMILAKCCHDMDILRWLVGVRCQSVQSIGTLTVFKESNAPSGSSQFCSDCSLDCIYNAQKLYLEYPQFAGYFHVGEQTPESILQQLKHCQYDRCVYRCDNDVVDHQNTIMQFENDLTIHHTMTAFSKEIYRDIKIHGTKAELVGVMEDGKIQIREFGGETQHIQIDTSSAIVGGHGGGDSGMMHELYMELNDQKTVGISYVSVSVESHKMAFAAEMSRCFGGVPQKI